MVESGWYPPGAENDPEAPWNQDEDNEYAEAEAKIEALDGQELYESAGADIDADMDVFDLKVLRRYDDSRKWSELSEHEQKLWDAYAEVRQGFAYLLLEDS